jgi:anaerobic selenocysteine-containing dehydrogenase
MSQRTIKTVCNLCGLSGCGMKIAVQDGKVVQVKGDQDHPENRGALCIKGQAVIDILYAPDRLKYPSDLPRFHRHPGQELRGGEGEQGLGE